MSSGRAVQARPAHHALQQRMFLQPTPPPPTFVNDAAPPVSEAERSVERHSLQQSSLLTLKVKHFHKHGIICSLTQGARSGIGSDLDSAHDSDKVVCVPRSTLIRANAQSRPSTDGSRGRLTPSDRRCDGAGTTKSGQSGTSQPRPTTSDLLALLTTSGSASCRCLIAHPRLYCLINKLLDVLMPFHIQAPV